MITKKVLHAPSSTGSSPKEFLGITLRDLYSPKEEESILNLLNEIGNSYSISDSILDHSLLSERLYKEIDLQNNLTLKVGSVSAFSQTEVAMIIFEQAHIYTDKATMGSAFPRDNLSLQKDLVATFLQGEKEMVIISIQFNIEGKRKMIGGCMVAYNDSSKKFLDTIQVTREADSLIPTFQSLRVKEVNSKIQDLFKDVKESEVVNPIRFWRQDTETLKQLKIVDTSLSKKVVASIPFGYMSYSKAQQKLIPRFAIVDTHDSHVVTLIESFFGAKKFAENGALSPTDSVLSTILKYHYGDEHYGGYFGRITVSYFETEEFIRRSQAEFKELWTEERDNTHDLCLILNPTLDRENKEIKHISNALRDRGEITEQPFIAGKEEVREFLEKHVRIPSDEKLLLDFIVTAVSKEAPQISIQSIETLFRPITHDFSRLVTTIRKYAKTIEEDSRFIYLPHKKVMAKYIGEDLHRALSQSRFLGLIPFDAINRIRSFRIGSIGASVAGGSLDQLVAIGAEHIDTYDESFLAPSNQPRMPSGSFLDNGQSKAAVIARQLIERNPYGHFSGIPGRVIANEKDRKTRYDITFEVFAESHDIFLEVADAPHIKAGFRKFMVNNYPTKPVFFIADVGNNPFSNLEIPAQGNYFGQGMDYKRLEILSNPAVSAGEAMGSVYEMVKDHFPDEHKVQFLLARLGISGFWSQTPISMRESAAITAKLLILYASGNPLTNKNITTETSPNNLYQYSNEDKRVLHKLYEQIFPN